MPQPGPGDGGAGGQVPRPPGPSAMDRLQQNTPEEERAFLPGRRGMVDHEKKTQSALNEVSEHEETLLHRGDEN